MKKLIALLMLVSPTAFAAPYIELGISHVFDAKGYRCVKGHANGNCSDNPIGYAAVGYEKNGFSVSLEHWSGIFDKDAGMNAASVKYRFTFK